MDRAITDEILEELSSALQRVEAQSSAILEFIKDRGIVKEGDFAPYLERANMASSVRWRAIRVRLEKLFSGLEKKQQQKEQQQDDERKEAAQKDAWRSEAGKAGEAKPSAKDETQKAQARPSLPQASHENHEPAQPKQPTHADGEAIPVKMGAGIAPP